MTGRKEELKFEIERCTFDKPCESCEKFKAELKGIEETEKRILGVIREDLESARNGTLVIKDRFIDMKDKIPAPELLLNYFEHLEQKIKEKNE